MTRHLERHSRRFLRSRHGGIYLELAAAMVILAAVFIGIAGVSATTIDFDRDTRAMRAGIDMLYVLDEDISSPDQSDFDILGQKILDVSVIDPQEEFEIHFTAVQRTLLTGVEIDWKGSYGTDPDLPSRVALGLGTVTVDRYDFPLNLGERLLIVEFYRSRRGLFRESSAKYYSKALALR